MAEELYFSFKKYCGVRETGDHLLHMPVRVGQDTLPNELEMLLTFVSKGNFVSYKNVSLAEVLIWFVLEKLEAYYKTCPEEAEIAGEKMISILESLETDDDTFPEYSIQHIRDMIHA